MTQKEQPSEADSVSLLLKIFEQRTAASVVAEEKLDYVAQKAMRTTHAITRVVLSIVVVLTPAIFYLIATLVLDMGTITNRMQSMADDVASMKTNFDQVSTILNTMDSSVVNMSHNIAVIPPIERQVASMNNNFSHMVTAMNSISPNVRRIDHLLMLMERDMAQMNNLFGHLNQSVFFMGRDVDTLSNPMRLFPFGR